MASQRVSLPHNCSFSSDYTPLGGSQEQYEGNINPIFWTSQKDKGRTDQKDKNTKRKKEGRVQRQIRKKTSLIYANLRENWSEVAWCNVDLSSLFQGKIREKK